MISNSGNNGYTGSNTLSGILILIFAGLLLLASLTLWSYSEHYYLWAWQYRTLHLLGYLSYTNLLKSSSLVFGLIGLLGAAGGLVLLALDGMARQLRGD